MNISIDQEGELYLFSSADTETMRFISDDPDSPISMVLSTNYLGRDFKDVQTEHLSGRIKVTVEFLPDVNMKTEEIDQY